MDLLEWFFGSATSHVHAAANGPAAISAAPEVGDMMPAGHPNAG